MSVKLLKEDTVKRSWWLLSALWNQDGHCVK